MPTWEYDVHVQSYYQWYKDRDEEKGQGTSQGMGEIAWRESYLFMFEQEKLKEDLITYKFSLYIDKLSVYK